MAEPEGKDAPEQPPEEGGLVATKKEFIQTFFKRAGEFTDELLRENERLRFRVVQLEEEARSRTAPAPAPSGNTLRELVARIEQLEHEREQLLARFRTVEADTADF